MFNAFMQDQSPFKKNLMMMVLLSVFSVASSVFLSPIYSTKIAENEHQKAEYTAQSNWFQKFDYKDATKLYNMVLKPCKLSDIDSVQSEQLSLLKTHNLAILSVKNDAPTDKPDKKIPVKYRKSTVVLTGTWNDLMSALHEFEKNHLVVITNSSFSLNDEKSSSASGLMKATLEYNIYFQ